MFNERTVITFSAAVEVPGVVLPAGTYVFKMVNLGSPTQVVQIFSQDERQVFATVLTIPVYVDSRATETVMRFYDRPSGSPQAIREWVVPGAAHGHAFVYPSESETSGRLAIRKQPAR